MMKKVLFILFLFGVLSVALLLIAARPLSQPCQTSPTATITAQPFYIPIVTATSQAIVNTNCSGVPYGWGTVTPNALWSYLCSSCLYNLSTPTGTPDSVSLTQTAIAPTFFALQSPTPSVTPSPTTTPTPPRGVIEINGGSVGLGGGGTVNVSCVPAGVPAQTVTCSVYERVGSNKANDYVYVSWNVTGTTPYQTIYVSYASTVSAGGNVMVEGSLTCTNAGNKSGSFSFFYNGLNFTTVAGVATQNCPTANSTSQTYITFSVYPISQPTAIPTSSPNSSYCSVVDGSTDTGFGYSGFILGDITCLDVGPLDLSSVIPSWLGGSLIPSVPWLAHICFQNVSIGQVEVFGTSINIDVLVYIAGFVAALALLLRK